MEYDDLIYLLGEKEVEIRLLKARIMELSHDLEQIKSEQENQKKEESEE